MTTISLEEAQANLGKLIDELPPGEGLVITRNDRPIAQIVGLPDPPAEPPRPIFGRGRGKIVILSDDDSHLEDFKEYME